MSSSIGFYTNNNPNDKYLYTGTEICPDTLSLFVITDDQKVSFFVEHQKPTLHLVGYTLLLSLFCIFRVVCAVKIFFDHIAKIHFKKDDPHLKECWNALQNVFRGVIEVIPCTGLFLFLYDLYCSKILIQRQIEKELEKRQEQGEVLKGRIGFACEGKIQALDDWKTIFPHENIENMTYEEQLKLLTTLTDKILNPDKDLPNR